MRTPLQKGEKILLVTYSSWISLIVPVLVAIIGIVASYFIGFTKNYGWIAALAGIIYLVTRYFIWKAYIWVVTNYRVIDEAGLLNHFAKESPLEKINNVSYDQNIWGRIFNYGHVEIQTAAQVGATDYYNVHHPKRLKDTITQAQSDLEHIKLANQATQMATALGLNKQGGTQTISAELEQLYNLKQRGVLTEEEYNRAKNKLLNS
ncbi:MAG: PH domain-containing protein [Bacteroidetes bacterium]|nr:PH domain-containing protein [Bacteroidota bacterium]